MSEVRGVRAPDSLRLASIAWAVVMVALGGVWAAGSTTGNVLAHDDAAIARVMGAALIVAGGMGVVSMLRRRHVVAGCVTVAVVSLPPAFGLPIVVVGGLVGEGSVGGSVEVVVQTVSLVGATVAASTARSAWRTGRGRCRRCGGLHVARLGTGLRWPASAAAGPRVRRWVLVCAGAFLPWGVLKQAWTWGVPWFGVDTADFDTPGGTGLARLLHAVGIDLTVAAAIFAGGLMSAGIHAWYPRLLVRIGTLGGSRYGDGARRVGRALLLAFAIVGSTLVLYGVPVLVIGVLQVVGVMQPWMGEDMLPPSIQGPMILFGGMTFTGIGVGLALAGRDFARRTRPRCDVGETPASEYSLASA